MSSAEWFHEGGACGGVGDIGVLEDMADDQENGRLTDDRARVFRLRKRLVQRSDSDRKSPLPIDLQLHLTATNPTARALPHPINDLGRRRDGRRCEPERSAMVFRTSTIFSFNVY
jgi:CHAD domain-containing protein